MIPKKKLSVEDYLEHSESWDLKHEWVNGEAYAMSGGTPKHAAVCGNVYFETRSRLGGKRCTVNNSDLRVNIPNTGSYLYPDVSIVCGPFQYAENDPNSITNPSAIFEVLSPSTADYDFGAKFDHYRRLETLQHYVLVDPEKSRVVHLERTVEGWLRRDLEEGDVKLNSLGITLPLEAIYANLEALG